MEDRNPARERDLIVALCRVNAGAEAVERARPLLSRPLDWNYVIVQAAKHKVLPLVWHNLLRWELVGEAMARSGLSELWAQYVSQLYAVNRERNRLYLDAAQQLVERARDRGLDLVVLKGGALIGDIYELENRMLNDIDFLALRCSAERIKEFFFSEGYQYGLYDYPSRSIKPLSRKVERHWVFQNHTLPTFFLLADGPCAFYKMQVGFDFFDNFEDYDFPSERVLAEARPKPGTPSLRVPSLEHMLINLCAHVYREGVSLVYNDYNVNWHLSILCDMLTFLEVHGASLDRERLARTLEETNLVRPYYYALHHAHELYREPLLASWLTLVDPGDLGYLNELRDGKTVVPCEGPFLDRLFSLRTVREEFRGGWNRLFDKSEW